MAKNMERGFGPISSEIEVFRMDDTAHDTSATYHYDNYTVDESGRTKRKLVWDHHAAPAAMIEKITIPKAIQDNERANKSGRVLIESALRDFDEQSATFDAEMAQLEATYNRQMSELKQAAGQATMPTSLEAPQSALQTPEERAQAMLDRIYAENPGLNWREGLESDGASSSQNDRNAQIDAPTESITPVTTFGTPEDLADTRHGLSDQNNRIPKFTVILPDDRDGTHSFTGKVVISSMPQATPNPYGSFTARNAGSPADQNATVPHGRRPGSSHAEQTEATPLTVLSGGQFGSGPAGVTVSPRLTGRMTRAPYLSGEQMTGVATLKPTGSERAKTTAGRRGNFLQKHRNKLLGGIAIVAAAAAGFGLWAAFSGNDSGASQPKVKAYAADRIFTPQEMNDITVNPTVSESYIGEYGGNATAGINSMNHDVDSAVAAKQIEKVYLPGQYDIYGGQEWYPLEYGKPVSFESTSKATIEPILAKQPGSEMRVATPDQVEQ